MKEELKNIKHAITLLQKAVAGLEGRLAVDTPKKQNGFKPPTYKEARFYFEEKGYGFDLGDWYDHYTTNGWWVGKSKMKNWKSSMSTWQRNHKAANPTRTKVQLDARGRPIRNEAGNLLL